MAEFLAFSIVILLFSVILHEVSHGLAARHFGDHTAEHAGRLTLNPIPHIDPIGTILLPILLKLSGSPILFGWAKPVPVNPLNFSDLRRGELLVSLAGVGANLALAIVGSVIFHFLNSFYPQPLLLGLAYYTVSINLVLTVFNLLPIPPLDGSKVLLSQLPYKWAKQYLSLERYGILIFLALWLVKIGDSSLIELILSFGVGVLRTVLGMGS